MIPVPFEIALQGQHTYLYSRTHNDTLTDIDQRIWSNSSSGNEAA